MYNGQFIHFLPEDLAHVTVSEKGNHPSGGLPEMLLEFCELEEVSPCDYLRRLITRLETNVLRNFHNTSQ